MDDFWAGIDLQITKLRTAATVAEVIGILREFEPVDAGQGSTDQRAFFAGSGGDEQMFDALTWDADWTYMKGDSIYYVLRDLEGGLLTYCEGDVTVGDVMVKA